MLYSHYRPNEIRSFIKSKRQHLLWIAIVIFYKILNITIYFNGRVNKIGLRLFLTHFV